MWLGAHGEGIAGLPETLSNALYESVRSLLPDWLLLFRT